MTSNALISAVTPNYPDLIKKKKRHIWLRFLMHEQIMQQMKAGEWWPRTQITHNAD